VRHHPRRFGRSKYGLGRTFRVMMDLLTIAFIKTFLTRPMHGFGLLGLFFVGLGLGLGVYLLTLKLGGQSIGQRPLLFLAGLAVIAGLQLFCFGLLAELLMRTYHESQGRPIYRVREIVGGEPSVLVDGNALRP
jgi:dolichol-phosphate mannosyltransferase